MMKRIDTDAISTRPEDRLRFLEDFVGFTDDDWTALRASTEVLVPRLAGLLDALYEHVLAYDDTRRIFVGVGGTIDPLYVDVRKRHGHGNAAKSAVARKILIASWHVLARNEPFKPAAPRVAPIVPASSSQPLAA